MKTKVRVRGTQNEPRPKRPRLTLVGPPPAPDAPAAPPGLQPVVGRLAGWSPQGPLVVVPGDAPERPRPARSLVRLTEPMAHEAASRGQEVLVAFVGEPAVPVVVGLLEGSPGAAPPPTEVVLDGERVVLEARREIELRCGEASITLQRDGRVVIKGAYVETRARGVNRIRGGAVKIN